MKLKRVEVLNVAESIAQLKNIKEFRKNVRLYYLLTTNLNNLAKDYEAIREALDVLNENHIEKDANGEKIPTEEGGFKVKDPEAYNKELESFITEEVAVKVKRLPIDLLDVEVDDKFDATLIDKLIPIIGE